MSGLIQLNISDVEFLAFFLAQEFLKWGEPIPEFNSRYPDRLESCLQVPFQSFGGHSPYPTPIDKASILFYLMNKSHPFQNGNKRIAMTTLMVFLYKNNLWLTVDENVFYRFARDIAASEAQQKDQTVNLIKMFLTKRCRPLT